MSVTAALDAAIADLTSLGVRGALVGGLAVSARAEPRFTRDADIAISVADNHAAEMLVYELRQLGYAIHALIEHEVIDRLLTVRLAARTDASVLIDLLIASSGIEAEIVHAAEQLDVTGNSTYPVATTGHLIALKLLSNGPHRGQDALDLDALASVATATDWAVAVEACELIVARDFHRGRDLPALAAELRERIERQWGG